MKTKKKNINTLKNKKKKVKNKKLKLDPRIEEVYEETVFFDCPIRGKVSQKVKIKRYKFVDSKTLTQTVTDPQDPLGALESKDDGLSMYDPDATDSEGKDN